MLSDLVSYHERSPDEMVEGCQNTGEVGDGVVFTHVEPQVGTHMFIGRRSIIEAAAALFDTTPDAVTSALSSPHVEPAPEPVPEETEPTLAEVLAAVKNLHSGLYSPAPNGPVTGELPPMQAKRPARRKQ